MLLVSELNFDYAVIMFLRQKQQQPQVPVEEIPAEESYKNDDVEYMFIRENPLAAAEEKPTGSFGPLPMRTNSDKLQYGTGSMFMLGLGSGGLYGFLRGWRKAKGLSYKLKLNSILNTTTRYGPWAANSMGIMTLGWALTDMSLEKIRGVNDDYNHLASAFVSGFVFKSTGTLLLYNTFISWT
jgi:hypothetical protein